MDAPLTHNRGGDAGPAPVPGVRDIVLVGSGKGGVGKSTVAVNLAAALARDGVRTGIVDLDLSGPSVARLTGTETAPELDAAGRAVPYRRHGIEVISVADMIAPEQAVAWKGPLIAQAVEQLIRDVAWSDLDILVVDLPPGTGDVLLTVVEQIPVAGAVIVTTPERMASVDAERAVALLHQHDIPVFGILRNMAEFVCPCCGERQPLFDPGATRDVARQMHVADLGALPADPAAARRAEDGVPIVVGEPDGVAAAAFAELSGAVKRAIAREHAGMRRRDNDSKHTIWELIHDE